MRRFQHFVSDPASAAFAHRVFTTKKDDSEQKERLTTYWQVFNSAHATCATDDVITVAEEYISSITQFERVSAVLYSGMLCEKCCTAVVYVISRA